MPTPLPAPEPWARVEPAQPGGASEQASPDSEGAGAASVTADALEPDNGDTLADQAFAQDASSEPIVADHLTVPAPQADAPAPSPDTDSTHAAAEPDLADATDVAATTPPAPAASVEAGVSNEDVRAMAEAKFSDTTVLAIIAANPTRFDISPRALVALKGAGVSEVVIEAMLHAETAKKHVAAAAEPAPAAPVAPPTPQPTEEFLKLSAMIERLATRQEAAEAASRTPDLPPSTDSSPRAWAVNGPDKTPLSPTIAKVAFTDEKNGARFKTLQSLAGKALAFVNPAVSGIATTLGGLFRSDDQPGTAVWALTGIASTRALGAATMFEIEFGHTPGVDPDRYQAAIVRLVRTNDNYRLVAAAKTEGTNTVVTARDPIVEELVPAQLTRIDRGRYRVQAKEALGPGEYALVLRPIVAKERKRKKSERSLGELFGGGTSQILYLTWDFAVTAD